MLYKKEILEMMRYRQPLETARMERKGTLAAWVEDLSQQFRQEDVKAVSLVNKRPTDGMERVYEGSQALMESRRQNLESLDMFIDWEPAARKQAVEDGQMEFESQEAEEDSVLEPFIQEFLPIYGGNREQARAKAREYGQMMQLIP